MPRCQYCGKNIKTHAGVKLHIAMSRRCHQEWEDSLAADSTFTVNRDEGEADGAHPPSPSLPSDEDEDDPMGAADNFTYTVLFHSNRQGV
jgi:hypothetical protein